MAYRKFIACGDNHGDMQDEKAVATFFEFAKHWNADVRIHWGDCFDFRALRKNASEEETRDRVDADLAMGNEFLAKYQPTHFLRGNHDERLWDRLLSDNGTIRHYSGKVVEEIHGWLPKGCEMLPYDKRKGVLRIGKLKVIHGYGTGVNAARVAAQIYGSVIQGHLHCVDSQAVASDEGKRKGIIGGCLCRLDMQYNRAHLQGLRQAHGWVYGLMFDDGTYHPWQAEEINGRWIFPTEFKELPISPICSGL